MKTALVFNCNGQVGYIREKTVVYFGSILANQKQQFGHMIDILYFAIVPGLALFAEHTCLYFQFFLLKITEQI